MRLSDPIPWPDVPVGAVVLLVNDDDPRTVLVNDATLTGRLTLIEGLGAVRFYNTETVRLVVQP